MPLIALKWDKDFLRIAVATQSRGSSRVQVERSMSVELAGETEELSPAKLGDKLRAILEKTGIQRGDATVIVARSDIEMRQFELPPVPAEEIPEMVRFQARNHFSSFGEDFLLDFIPVSTTDESNTVLATAISADKVQKIRDTVDATGLKLRHIVVRPFAAAELVRSVQPSSGCRVILEIIGREADISVVDNDFVRMTRTVRVPESYTVEKFDAWLPGEIRRTIASARGQSGAPDVQEIIVCGNDKEHKKLSDDLKETFKVKTGFFPPFASVSRSTRFEQPAQTDGFASLLGSLVQSSGDATHGLDFLNPRKKPEQKADRKQLLVAGGLVACVAIIAALIVWSMYQKRDATIADLRSDIQKLKDGNERTDVALERTRFVDNWKSLEYDWLEELFKLSSNLPDPDNTRLSQFSAEIRADGAGIDLRGFLDEEELTMANVTDKLKKLTYSVQQKQNIETNEAGFDRFYNLLLGLRQAVITPKGEKVIPGLDDEN